MTNTLSTRMFTKLWSSIIAKIEICQCVADQLPAQAFVLVNTTFCELLVRSSLTNHYSWRNLGHYEEGGKFLRKLWRASVLDYNRVI